MLRQGEDGSWCPIAVNRERVAVGGGHIGGGVVQEHVAQHVAAELVKDGPSCGDAATRSGPSWVGGERRRDTRGARKGKGHSDTTCGVAVRLRNLIGDTSPRRGGGTDVGGRSDEGDPPGVGVDVERSVK